MRDELVERLHKDYPDLCKKADDGDFGVGDGWFNIIDTLCSLMSSKVDRIRRELERLKIKDQALTHYTEHQLHEALEELPVIKQVKEKFGALRFYVDGVTDEHRAYIDFAESLSMRTCEECGAPGTPRNAGWTKTLCDKHHREREAGEDIPRPYIRYHGLFNTRLSDETPDEN